MQFTGPRHCLAVLLGTALASPCAAEPGIPRNVRLSHPLRKCVVATYRLWASEKEAAEDVHAYLFLPQDEPRQRVEGLFFFPKPREIITDKHGRKIALFIVPRIAPGRHAPVRWIAKLRTYEMKVLVKKEFRSRRQRITKRIRRLYLADGSKYRIHSPYVRRVAGSIAPSGTPPLALVKKTCEYLTEQLTYEREGKWDSAEKVLKRGTGSCSEYTYCFIALCRARGVPARYVGATTCRRRTGCAFDRPNHRWGEAYVEGYGWVQADVLQRGFMRNGGFRITNRRLILGHGDGGANSPCRWSYTGRAKAKAGLHASQEFFWCDPVSQTTLNEILAAAGVTHVRKRPSSLKAVSTLSSINRGLCIPFLADFLWAENTEVVARAAEAICRMDALAARNVRYFVRKNRRAAKAMSAALETAALGRRRKKKTGEWTNIFDGKRLLARRSDTGPFKVRDGWLTNVEGKGMMLSRYTTGDRCIIDLLFKHTGPGRAALLFGHSGRDVFLKLPFHVPTEPHVKENYLPGARCRIGLYGATEGQLHRATVAVNGCKVRFDFDGKTIYDLEHPNAGPGRVGLTVWGERTRFAVKRMRVMEVPKGRAISRVLSNAGVMALEQETHRTR